MELPVHESMAYYFSKLTKIFDHKDLQSQAQHYEQCVEDFFNTTTYSKPQYLVSSIKMHNASILIQTRESERERQEKGHFPSDSVVKDSFEERKAKKYNVSNPVDLKPTQQQLEKLIFAQSVDFINIKRFSSNKQPVVDDGNYEIVDIIGRGSTMSIKE